NLHARRAARVLRALLDQQRTAADGGGPRSCHRRTPAHGTGRAVRPSHLQGPACGSARRLRTARFTLALMAVHPWNKEFAWRTPPPPYRRINTDQARQWDDDGYFLLEDAIDRDSLAEVETAIDPFEEKFTTWLRARGGTLAIADADAITF